MKVGIEASCLENLLEVLLNVHTGKVVIQPYIKGLTSCIANLLSQIHLGRQNLQRIQIMTNPYFTYLYNECKRHSDAPIDSNHIIDFINSLEGQKGQAVFLAMRSAPQDKSRVKSVGSILGVVL